MSCASMDLWSELPFPLPINIECVTSRKVLINCFKELDKKIQRLENALKEEQIDHERTMGRYIRLRREQRDEIGKVRAEAEASNVILKETVVWARKAGLRLLDDLSYFSQKYFSLKSFCDEKMQNVDIMLADAQKLKSQNWLLSNMMKRIGGENLGSIVVRKEKLRYDYQITLKDCCCFRLVRVC
jgi:hypothetical protein